MRLDWPVGTSAGGHALFDDLGNTSHVGNSDVLLPVGKEGCSLPGGGRGSIGGAGDEVAASRMDVAAILDGDRAELVALVVHELFPVADFLGRAHVCGVARGG